MIVELIAVALLAVAIFAFVLEPVLRAKSDVVQLDAVAMPRPGEHPEDAPDAEPEPSAEVAEDAELAIAPRVVLDRPAGSDAS